MVGEEICGAVVSVRFQVSACENWHVLPCGRAAKSAPCSPLPPVLLCRRTSSPYGTRQPATRPQQPGYATRYEECSTYLPTPSWNIKPTPIASSMCAGQGGAAGCMRARAAQCTAQALAEVLVCVRAVPANWSANSSSCCQHALKAKFLCCCCAVVRDVWFYEQNLFLFKCVIQGYFNNLPSLSLRLWAAQGGTVAWCIQRQDCSSGWGGRRIIWINRDSGE